MTENVKMTEQLLHRICNEFLEMPGLRLTRRQAQRLWGLDEERCAEILELLVAAKFLARTSADSYARVADGPAVLPRLHMARAMLRQMAEEPNVAGDRSGRPPRLLKRA
jgi:hypothetical protein